MSFGDYRLGKHGIGRVILKGADDMGVLAKSDSGVARASTGSQKLPEKIAYGAGVAGSDFAQNRVCESICVQN